MKTKYIFSLLFLSLAFTFQPKAIAQTGPGGVGNSSSNYLWLDAARLQLNNNDPVSSWTDFSGNNNTATQGTSANQPVYLTNYINARPALYFNGNYHMQTGAIAALNTNQFTWFIVGESNNTLRYFLGANYTSGALSGNSLMWGTYKGSANDYRVCTRRADGTQRHIGMGSGAGYQVVTGRWSTSSTAFWGWRNGSQSSWSGADASPSGHNFLRVGAASSGFSNNLIGYMSEVIVYNTLLNTTQRIIVENYLASKYGATILNDFYAYDATHSYDVTGIGQTSVSDNHTTAQGSGIVEISNPSALSNGEYLFVGHNNATPTLNTTDVPIGTNNRLNRTWRAGVTGSPGTVTLNFDLSGYGWAEGSTYQLLIDNDGVFADATIHTTGLNYNPGTSILTFTNVPFSDGQYFTLASDAPAGIISVATGNWNNPATWNCNCIPGTVADVTIDNTHIVTLSTNQSAGNLTINATGELDVTNSSTLTLEGTIFNSGTFTAGTGTVVYASADAQDIADLNYYNLTSTNTGNRILPNGGTVGIAGTFTTGSNSYTITGSTVEFNGSGAQVIPAFNFHHLASSSSGTRTINSGTTVGIAGTFTPGTNNYTLTGSTVVFNGTGPQTIPALNYHHLTSTSTGNRTLSSSGTIGIAGTFTPSTNTYTVTSSTVNFNGAGAQTIPDFNFFNLTFSSTGSRDMYGKTIGIAGTFNPGTNTVSTHASKVYYNGSNPQLIAPFQYYDLHFTNTGSISLSTLNNIKITRMLYANTATVFSTNSTVEFNGSGNQSIYRTGGSTPAVQFDNILINKSGGSFNLQQGQFAITGTLTFATPTVFNTNSRVFTFISDAFNTARIAEMPVGASINGGGMRIQRYIDGRIADWVDMTSPVSNSTINDWDQEIFMSGVGGNNGNSQACPTCPIFYSVWAYDGPNQEWDTVTSITRPMNPGEGFELFLGDDLNNFAEKSIDTRGTANFGNVSATSYLGGSPGDFSLIGNPYPSWIDWNLVSKSNVANEVWIYNYQFGTYQLFSTPPIEIPSTQGFWVETTGGAPSVTFTESSKTTSTSSTFTRKKPYGDYEFILQLGTSLAPNKGLAYFRFNDEATLAYETADAKQLPVRAKRHSLFAHSLSADGVKLALNTFSPSDEQVRIPVVLSVPQEGIYSLELLGHENVNMHYSCIMLKDVKSGKYTDLNATPYLSFDVADASKDHIFELILSRNDIACRTAPTEALNQVSFTTLDRNIVVQTDFENDEMVQISVSNLLGQKLQPDQIVSTSSKQHYLSSENWKGVVLISVKSSTGIQTKKLVMP